MPTLIGTGFIEVVPRLTGNFGSQIEGQLVGGTKVAGAKAAGEAEKAGAQAGQRYAGGLRGAMSGMAGPIAATLAVVAGAGAVLFKVGDEFDKAYDNIRVRTGATGAVFDGLKTSLKNVAMQSSSSIGDIGTAMADLNARTGQTGPGLELLTRQMLTLSSRMGGDLRDNIRQTTRLFGDWSISSKDQAGALDFLFKASQKTGVGIADLEEKVVFFGAPLRQFGFSFQDAATMLSKWEKEGVNITTVLAGMRMGLGNLTSETKRAAIEKDLGIKISKDPKVALLQIEDAIKHAGSAAEANHMAFTVFGKRAGPDMAAAIREGRFDIKGLEADINHSGETILGTSAKVRSFSQTWAMVKNAMKVTVEPLAIAVFNGVSAALEGIRTKLLPFAKELMEKLKPAGEAIAALFKALAPILGFVAKVVGGVLLANFIAIGVIVGVVAKAWMLFVAAAKVVIGVLLDVGKTIVGAVGPPVQRAMATVWGAIQTGLKAIKSAWDTVWGTLSTVIGPIWTGIKAAVSVGMAVIRGAISAGMAVIHAVWNAVWGALSTVIGPIWNGIRTVVGGAISAISSVISTGVNAIRAVWNGIWSRVSADVKIVWNAIGPIVRAGISAISTVISAAMTVVRTVWNAAWTAMSAIVTAVWAVIGPIVRVGITAISAAISAAMTVVRTVWNAAWTGISAVVSAVWAVIGPIVRVGISAISTVISAGMTVVRTVWNAAWTVLSTVLGAVWTAIKAVVKVGMDWIFSPISTGLAAIRTAWNAAWAAVSAALSAVWAVIRPIVQAGMTVIQTVITAGMTVVRTLWNAAWTAISAVVTTVWNVIRPIIQTGISVISTVISTGMNAIKTVFSTVWNAISAAFTVVWNALKTTVTTVTAAISTTVTTVWNAIKTVFSTVWNAISAAFTVVWNALKTTATTVINAISTTVTTVWNAVKTTFTTVWNAISAAFTVIWNVMKTTATTVINAISTLVTTVWNTVKTTFATIWNTISAAFTVIWNVMKTTATTIINAISATITAVWNTVKTTFATIWNAISAAFTAIWNVMKTTATTIINAISATVTTVWNTVKGTFTTIWNAISAFFTTIWNALRTTATTVINAISATVTTVWNTVKGTFTSVWTAISSFFSGIWNTLKSVASTAIDGISSKISTVMSAISSAWSSAWNGMKNAMQTIWAGIATVFKTPINVVIDVVNGFDHIVNNIIAWALGGSRPLPEGIAHLAAGGKLPGYGGGDTIPAMLEPGEAVVPKHLVPEMAPWAKEKKIPGFATGGVVGVTPNSPNLSPLNPMGVYGQNLGTPQIIQDVAGAIGDAANWVYQTGTGFLKTGAAALAEGLLAPIKAGVHTTLAPFGHPGEWVVGAFDKVFDSVINWIHGHEQAPPVVAGPGGGLTGQWAAGILPWVQYITGALNISGMTYDGHHPDEGHAVDLAVGQFGMINTAPSTGPSGNDPLSNIARWVDQNIVNAPTPGWYVGTHAAIHSRGGSWSPASNQVGRRGETYAHDDHVHVSFDPRYGGPIFGVPSNYSVPGFTWNEGNGPPQLPAAAVGAAVGAGAGAGGRLTRTQMIALDSAHGLPNDFLAIGWQESGWNPNASNAGLFGIMSPMIAGNLRDPNVNAANARAILTAAGFGAWPWYHGSSVNGNLPPAMATGGLVVKKRLRHGDEGGPDSSVRRMATGGLVGGTGAGDTVSAMLQPQEFVMNKAATARYLPLLQMLNSGGSYTEVLAGLAKAAATHLGKVTDTENRMAVGTEGASKRAKVAAEAHAVALSVLAAAAALRTGQITTGTTSMAVATESGTKRASDAYALLAAAAVLNTGQITTGATSMAVATETGTKRASDAYARMQASVNSLHGTIIQVSSGADIIISQHIIDLTHQLGIAFTAAEGGIAHSGAALPSHAVIAPAAPGRGLVQWAEPETGGEAFIPLAAGKRKRSVEIWRHTGKLLGQFAAGGMLGVNLSDVLGEALFNTKTRSIQGASEGIARTLGQKVDDAIAKKVSTAATNTIVAKMEASVAALQAAAAAAAAITSAGVGGGDAVTRWAAIVDQALTILGQPLSLEAAVLRRINFESSGNPNAINLTDSNAAAGTPSKGLIQVIDPTFAAYHWPGSSMNIYDPLANILAGLNYAIHTYGSIAAIDPLVMPTGYGRGGFHNLIKSYDRGGMMPPGLSLSWNGTGRPEPVGGAAAAVQNNTVTLTLNVANGDPVTMRAAAQQVVDDALTALARRLSSGAGRN